MRVWVYPERTWEELGAVRWSVTWHTPPKSWKPTDEESPDPDEMTCHTSAHASERAAKAAARRRIKDDFYGCPIVQKQVVDWFVEEDKVAEWSDVGETIYVS